MKTPCRKAPLKWGRPARTAVCLAFILTGPSRGVHAATVEASEVTVRSTGVKGADEADGIFVPNAEADTRAPWSDTVPERWTLHGQTTAVPQGHFAFVSPYEGERSLTARGQVATSWTATLFAGVRPWRGGGLFINPEIAAGTGLGATHGVAAFPNGEIYRVDRAAPRFNWSRLFVQQTWRLGSGDVEQAAGANQLAGYIPLRRLTFIAGKFSLNDYLDKNAYAHDPRTQFLNWALMDTGAYDYAADTRGYTWGALVDVNYPQWALRAAVAMVPTVANGLAMDNNLREAGSFTVEADYRYGLGRFGNGTLRALVYDNRARMGVYADAVRDAAANVGLLPDVQQTRGYRSKWGGALSFEHNLGGNNGVFLKLGWADGRYESWAFTEIERSLAVGGQIDGALWQRRNDRIGVALLVNGIAKEHMRYLGAGGIGFIIGDGGLHYGPEGIIEGYYAWQVTSWMALTADIQGILNPGYNRDRGPLAVGAIRLHLAY